MKRIYLSTLSILLVILSGWNSTVFGQTTSFAYISGAIQTYVVPGGITSLAIDMAGGNGGNNFGSADPGLGGRVTCVLTVTPGQVLDIVVGGVGTNGSSSCSLWPGGYNGGGVGYYYGGAGGGASDIRIGGTALSQRVIVAGAGGGGGYNDGTCTGGAGGGLTGGNGVCACSYYVGGGGSQSAGGSSNYSVPGSFGIGGNSYTGGGCYYNGAGGGGYYGGGGGAYYGGGGGGSSYAGAGTSNVVHTQGYNTSASGNGYVNICPGPIMGSITGTLSACPGTTTTLADGTSSVVGTWSTSSPTAVVGATTGVVTGISAGVATITYTATNSCSSGKITAAVTINPTPPAFTGPVNVCPGTTITLTDATTGGTWSTGSALVTIGGTTGVVTGVSAGIPTLTYTAPTGCTITGIVVVNPAPLNHIVTGGGNYCPSGTGVSIGLNGSDFGVNYQLFYGSAPELPIVSGAGIPISFGSWTGVGTYTVMATNPGSGCTANMSGSATVATYPAIIPNNVIGGGPICAGSTGVAIGLDGSTSGLSYQLYNGLAGDGPAVTGTGSPISFGTRSLSGTRTVVATNTTTGCTQLMTGSTTITVNPNPPSNNLTTPIGTTYCAGGTGVSVGVDGSSLGVSYHLMNGTTTVATMTGTGSPFVFPTMVTVPGSYTVSGFYSTGCSTVMSGIASVSSIPLPPIEPISGGGGYCTGALTGPGIGLAYSDAGVNYQLFNGTSPASAIFAGTDSSLYFGTYLATGIYHVVATNAASSCTSTMAGTAVVAMNPLPSPKLVSGGGSFCPGSSTTVLLAAPASGVSYQLFNGSLMSGSPMTGSGSTLVFSSVTDSGSYTVIGTDLTTGCSAPMTGGALVSPYHSPTVYSVNGGGSFCAGGTGVTVGLAGSDASVTYNLYVGTTYLTSMTGSGSAFNFGTMTGAGNYTIKASNSTGCNSDMSGSANVTVNPVPEAFSVMGGGPYCNGGTGSDISLSFSTVGVTYSLYMGGIFIDSAGGTGATLDLGSQMTAGTYTVVGTNSSTFCMNGMSGSAVVSILSLPSQFGVSGTGSFCQGGAGLPVTLGGSATATQYQLYLGTLPVGTALTGTGGTLNFGVHAVPGIYTVGALSTTTGCTNSMTGNATITVNPSPILHTVTGGGNYCAMGAGVSVGLDTSDLGIRYTLYYGTTNLGNWLGNGGSLGFGNETGTGSYMVVAKDTATGCMGNMSGTATVTTLTLPLPYTVIGGGSYCAGSTGSEIKLSSSTSGVRYYLNNGGVIDSLTGTGGMLNFGPQTMSGTFTVNASNITTGCTNNMLSSAMVTANPLPDTFDVMGGGSYCASGLGMPVSLSGSVSGIHYVLYLGTSAIGTYTGSGSSISFGTRTAPGTYSVVAVNPSTGCNRNMNANAMITVNPLVVPSVTVGSSIPTTVCAGTMGAYTATEVNGGSTPSYQWYVGGLAVGTGGSGYGFTPSNGQNVYVKLTSSDPCASPATVTSAPITMTVLANQVPSVSLNASSENVCHGSNVFFTAMPVNGGTGATYSWVKNGNVIGVGSSVTYNALPSNNDNISVIMTSNYPCIIGSDSAASNMINVSVAMPLDPVVIVTANPSNIIKMNASVTFKAHVTGAGATPMFQWSVNGNQVAGATDSMYTNNNFNNADVVTCSVTGSNICGTMSGNSNQVVMSVENTTGVGSVAGAGSDLKLMPNPNKGDFTIKGSLATSVEQTIGIEITNMIGQVVYSQNVVVTDGKINQHIQLNNGLSGGVYMLNLTTQNGNSVFHFVVE